MQVKKLTVGPFETNCFLVFMEEDRALYIIDPGDEGGLIAAEARKFDFRTAEILLTHYHIDHIHGAEACARELGLKQLRLRTPDHPFYLSPENCLPPYFPEPLKNPPAPVAYGDDPHYEVLALPGHTKGGAGLLFGKTLFCGDTLFRRSMGRTDLPGGDDAEISRSILDVLMKLPDDTLVCCGHGPDTSIGDERRYNPYINGVLQ